MVHLCSAFGPRVAVSERASLYSTLRDPSLTEQTQTSLHLSCSSVEVNELQRLIYPVCSAGDLCVEKDFGASIPEIKS